MILYQLAKWMEERNRLTTTIQESQGDVSFLLHKKEQVDEQIMAQAIRWLDPQVEAAFPLPADLPDFDQTQELAN